MDNNIHNLRDALEWLDRRIRDEAELDGEMTNEHAIELAFIQRTLERFPLRNCGLFETWEAALSAFREETGNSKPLELWLRCEIQAFAIWLYALAKPETKGGGDGR